MSTADATTTIVDIPFDEASDVTSIELRLHPIDVGFDLRSDDIEIEVPASAETLRVSYPARDGSRRVMSGPRAEVLRRLGLLGFRFIDRATP